MKTIILFLRICATAFAVDISLGEIENGFVKSQADPKILTISVIDTDKANTLFRKFAQDKDIPFKYPLDGCYARATAMARIAEGDSVQMGKVYAEGSLQVKTESAKYPIVQWGWHVAPIAYVKQNDGKIELMVFDPSLFNKPIPVEDWKNMMMYESVDYKPEVRSFYYGGRFQYFPKFSEGFKVSWLKKDLDNTAQTMKKYYSLQDLPPPSQPDAGKKPTKSIQ